MSLLIKEYKKLEETHDEIIIGTASSSEMKEFLHLIVKSSNKAEMLSYMNAIGFDSIEKIGQHLNKEKKMKESQLAWQLLAERYC